MMKEIIQLRDDYIRRHESIQEMIDEQRRNSNGSLSGQQTLGRLNGKAEAYRSLIAELNKIISAEPENDIIQLTGVDGDHLGLYKVKTESMDMDEASEMVEQAFVDALANEEDADDDFDLRTEADNMLAEKGIYRIWAEEASADML